GPLLVADRLAPLRPAAPGRRTGIGPARGRGDDGGAAGPGADRERPHLPVHAWVGPAVRTRFRPRPSRRSGGPCPPLPPPPRRTAAFIAERRERPADEAALFPSAEQALVLGPPLHPTAKSREGLSDTEARLYSPELRGSFPLHWLAVAPAVLAADSAWTERG